MRSLNLAILAAAIVAASPGALAQTVSGTTDVARSTVLRAGTAVPLRMLSSLTTKGKKLKVGARFDLEVVEPVSAGADLVIPAGSRAVGEVTSVRNKGMWGKSGKIEARLLYVRANGVQIRLTGALDDKGTTGTAGVVGAAAVLPIAGFFLTGTSANIPAGTNVTGYLEEDIALPLAAGGAAPNN